MKCYLQNYCGTVFRADKIKWLKELLPKPTDISRRIILCQQNKIQFQPYELRLVETDFEKLNGFEPLYRLNCTNMNPIDICKSIINLR